MREWLFFIRVYFKKPVLWLSAALCLVLVVFAFSASRFKEDLPYACCSLDDSIEAEQVMENLSAKNFVVCRDEKEVYDRIRSGTADTGMILYEGFAEKLKSDDLNDCAMIVTSKRSMNAGICKIIAAAAIYEQVMPYKAAVSAGQMGFAADAQDIQANEEKVKDLVHRLEFEITTVSGASAEKVQNESAGVGVTAIICFVLFGMLAAAMISRNSRQIRPRFSSAKGFFAKCLLPQCAAAGLWILAAAAAGLAVSSALFGIAFSGMILALVCYLVILVLLFSVLSLINIPSEILIALIAIDAVLSLILCPIYGEAGVLLAGLKPLRFLSIPSWIYLFLF